MVRGSQPLSTRSERLMAPRDNAIDGSAILPPNDETITDLIHRQMPMSMPLRQQINRDRITDEFFNTVAHRTRAEFWMNPRRTINGNTAASGSRSSPRLPKK